MKTNLYFFQILFLTLFCGVSMQVNAQMTHVKNETDLISQEEAIQLDQKLKDFDAKTSTQIGILLINSLNGKSEREVAIDWARKIGIGQKSEDNGAVILVAKQERKMSIEIGYGLEGVSPDAKAKEIINIILKPNFKANQYAKGLNEAVDELMRLAQKETFKRAEPQTEKNTAEVKYEVWDFWRIVAYCCLAFLIFRLLSLQETLNYILLFVALGWTIGEFFLLAGKQNEFLCGLTLVGGYVVIYWIEYSNSDKIRRTLHTKLKLKDRIKDLEALKEDFVVSQVDEQLYKVQAAISDTENNYNTLSNLLAKINVILKNPQGFLTMRTDRQFQKINETLTQHDFFIPEHQAIVQPLLKSELAYFEMKSAEELSQSDEQRAKQSLDKLNFWINTPSFKSKYLRSKDILFNEDYWDLLTKTHAPKEAILAKRTELISQFKQLNTLDSLENLNSNTQALDEINKNPDKFFTKRFDADFVKIAFGQDLMPILEDAQYNAQNREEAKKRLNESMQYFGRITQADAGDLEKLATEIDYFTSILQAPQDILKYDTTWLRNKIDTGLQSIQWDSYTAYTSVSRNNTKANFLSKWQNLKQQGSQIKNANYAEDLADFYFNSILAFKQSPSLFLTKEVQQTHQNTYSNSSGNTYSSGSFWVSSGSSYSDSSSSYSDTSSYSDSSSSYSDSYSDSSWGGGGDFGGGGASGDW